MGNIQSKAKTQPASPLDILSEQQKPTSTVTQSKSAMLGYVLEDPGSHFGTLTACSEPKNDQPPQMPMERWLTERPKEEHWSSIARVSTASGDTGSEKDKGVGPCNKIWKSKL